MLNPLIINDNLNELTKIHSFIKYQTKGINIIYCKWCLKKLDILLLGCVRNKKAAPCKTIVVRLRSNTKIELINLASHAYRLVKTCQVCKKEFVRHENEQSTMFIRRIICSLDCRRVVDYKRIEKQDMNYAKKRLVQSLRKQNYIPKYLLNNL